jgi:phosphoglycerol transferase MdoB-like AlkP superfamily enzyme
MDSPRTPPPNVVFILLESVSAQALHCYDHQRSDITPNIDALAEQGILFEHCLSPASFSSYSIVSIMTSLHMLRDQTNDHFADKSFPFIGLPRVLKLAGYELAMFSSGNESFDNINQFYPPSDFDHYFSHDTCDIPKTDCMRMDDKHAVGEFEKWINQRTDPRPFYCSFYLQSTHFNYTLLLQLLSAIDPLQLRSTRTLVLPLSARPPPIFQRRRHHPYPPRRPSAAKEPIRQCHALW